jgi:branched-chain amino acid transport system substrate-binding protein
MESRSDSILATNYNSIVGPIAWHNQPVKNVTKTPLVGGQWIPGSQFKGGISGQQFKNDLVIVNNEQDPTIGLQRKLQSL